MVSLKTYQLEKKCLLNFQSETNDDKPFKLIFSQTKGEFPDITGYKIQQIFKLSSN